MAGTSQQEVDAVDLKMEAQLGQWVPIVNEGTSREWTLDYVYTVDDRLPDGDDLLTRWKLVGNYGADEIACVEIQLNIA
ncbi:hypothetical protein N7490_004773 [Penicillium lividum]|nr:hypothetical protein N7490_004773 [Penicillium lividum]